MPIVLLIIGAILIVAGARGNTGLLVSLLDDDLTGKDNFGTWILAIGGIGLVGFIKPLKPVSDAFLVLILVAIFLANDKSGGGFFANLNNLVTGSGASASPAVSQTPSPPALPQIPTYTAA